MASYDKNDDIRVKIYINYLPILTESQPARQLHDFIWMVSILREEEINGN
jgi:hypothetical protein